MDSPTARQPDSATAQKRRHRTNKYAWALCFGLTAVGLFAAIWRNSLYANYSPINGTFQTFNPVHRLALGQAPYTDFTNYLGLGPIFVVKLFWSNPTLAGLITASNLACAASALLVFWVCAAVAGQRSLIHPALLFWGLNATFGFASLLALPPCRPLRDLAILSMPGTSLLPIRCALPFLQAAILYGLATKRRKNGLFESFRDLIQAGLLAGAGFSWSNDYGLVSCVALLAMAAHSRNTVRPRKFKPLAILTDLVVLATAALAALVGSVALVTRGHVMEWVHYNFVGVLRDQPWFFEGGNILLWRDLPFDGYVLGGIFVYAVCIARYLLARPRAHRIEADLFAFVYTACLLAGCGATLGGHWDDRYFSAFLLVSWFASAQLLVAGWGRVKASVLPFFPRSPLLLQGQARFTTGLPLALLAALVLSLGHSVKKKGLLSRPGPDWTFVAELGGYVPAPWAETLRLGRQFQTELAHLDSRHRIFSAYSSGLDLLAGAIQPSRADYIIHALGQQERGKYLAAFRDAQAPYATTFREDWNGWERWIRSANWWWYKELYAGYAPLTKDATHVVWHKKPGGIVHERHALRCVIKKITGDKTILELTRSGPLGGTNGNPRIRLANVKISYTSARQYSTFPWRGTGKTVVRMTSLLNSQAAADKTGKYTLAMNLQPVSQTIEVLAIFATDGGATLHLDQYPRDGSILEVEGCSATDVAAIEDTSL